MSQEAEFDPKDFENADSDRSVYARFYYRPVQNEEKSAAEGRPVFDEVAFIEIMTPGDAKDVRRRPVREADKRRFGASYAKFREGDLEQLTGTPLTEVTWINSAQREELLYMKCRTVEQLAELNDQACSRVAGMYDLKRKAGEWLAKATASAPFTALHKEHDKLKEANAVLLARLEALESAAAKVKPAKPKEQDAA